ncbi:polysaccharide biosynthesis C-terminal domain-containing protein [Algibacter sp. 2305UL17-15]|uniref:lipopolysaccharide biosynthesis protein n=1 Tax=Algibacter sp. 2305UL17-15 TaxID=3231268 RepID=UPI0034581F91
MGIVASQSIKNIISTYLGFAIGAINTLFLYTNFMSDAYYGMVGFMLSAAFVMMPLMAFGVNNTLIKFYSSFKTRIALNSFLTLMLFLPLLMIVPLSIVGYFGYEIIGDYLSTENPIIKNYLWHTIVIAIALAYFEVFYAWVKVQLQTVFGNFMKEVFHRVGTMILLVLLYLNFLSIEQFMIGLVIVYILRVFVMMAYAFSVKLPVIIFKKVNGITGILKYSALIIIAGSIATILLDVDKVMLGKYIPIKNIAYYNVAIFIAAVVAVPQRAMHQILLPLSAKYLNEKDYKNLGDLYKRSSLNLFIVGGLIFLLIILNINQLYYLIAGEYRVGLYVVLLISLSKLFEALIGSNNAILFNSDYYRMVLVLGVLLVIFMVLLNTIFIPLYGINGAALATFIAVLLYNTAKVVFVYKAFNIIPFTVNTIKVAVVIAVMALLGYFWDFNFHPILNIFLKSVIITGVFSVVVYRFKFSEDINGAVYKFLKKSV